MLVIKQEIEGVPVKEHEEWGRGRAWQVQYKLHTSRARGTCYHTSSQSLGNEGIRFLCAIPG